MTRRLRHSGPCRVAVLRGALTPGSIIRPLTAASAATVSWNTIARQAAYFPPPLELRGVQCRNSGSDRLPLGAGTPAASPILDQSFNLVIGVLTQQQAIPDHVVDRALHRIVVVIERGIALLDRSARIAGGFAARPWSWRTECTGRCFHNRRWRVRPAAVAQPVYVARGTVTSGRRTPAMSLPSLSVFGTKLG